MTGFSDGDTLTNFMPRVGPTGYVSNSMKFVKNNDSSSIIYNQHIILSNIPEKAFEYKICGKSAIQWVVDRRRITEYSDSNLINDCNSWSIETMNNPKYSLELIQRMITVSIETMKIVKALPKLDI